MPWLLVFKTPHHCSQIHGNVCMAAVVVTEQLDWRLHGFDLLSEHAGGGFDWPLMASSWMVRLSVSCDILFWQQ